MTGSARREVSTKKELAIALSRLQVFAQPDARLEQYPTDSETAATLLWSAFMHGDIEGRRVADLGCGTGILGIGALLLGAAHATFIDKDKEALAVLRTNLAGSGMPGSAVSIIEHDVKDIALNVDTVVQNPPFGTRQEHADRVFLDAAMIIAPNIYTMHKASTEEYIIGYAEKRGFAATDKHRFSFPLKASMAHHTRRIRRIDVTGLRLTRR